jgi:hypothetical protein
MTNFNSSSLEPLSVVSVQGDVITDAGIEMRKGRSCVSMILECRYIFSNQTQSFDLVNKLLCIQCIGESYDD